MTSITVTVATAHLFGDEDPEYDHDASADRYAELLRTSLQGTYPDADITVNTTANLGATAAPSIDADDWKTEEEIRLEIQATEEYLFNNGDWYVSK